MRLMNNTLLSKLKESINAVMPVSIIVILISLITNSFSIYTLISFVIGSILLVLGMWLFTLGADISMIPMGEKIGKKLTKKKSLVLILIVSFILGTIVTVAEPDLKVLASQVSSIPSYLLMLLVGIGVGLFFVISSLKSLFKIKLSYVLAIVYFLIFIIAFFVPSSFIPLGFDSGGVTTGPLTVPLIVSLGVGLTFLRGNGSSNTESFGVLGLCSAGPILIILILGLLFHTDTNIGTMITIEGINSLKEVILLYINSFPIYILEVLYAFSPILIFFVFFQLFYLHIKRKQLIKIIKGLIYTYLGLVIFLTAANVAFMPIGYLIGKGIAASSYKYLLIPLGAVLGYFIVKAEPAVLILEDQVEEITEGNIKGKTLGTALSIGVAVSVGLTMMRILFDIPILYFLVPGYFFAVAMSFYVPEMFTGIAFDSGGVASGPMAATFLLPFAIGTTVALGGNILKDAFGIVAIVSMTPLITVQLIGLIYKIKLKGQERIIDNPDDELIIDYLVEVS